jgi:MGT family glycosyltransferase
MPSKHYLFTTWDGGGNSPPELSVAAKLVRRGHSVRFLTDPTLETEVRRVGCEFSPWTTAPHRTTRDKSGDVFRDYEFKNPMKMIDAYLRDFLSGPAAQWVADTLGELSARPADALVTDFGIPTTLIAAEKLGVPSAVLYPNIWMMPTPGIPPMGPGFMPARGPLGRLRDAVMRSLSTRMFDKALPAINAVRAEHGLPLLHSTNEQMLRADRLILLTSPLFDFTSPAMPGHVRYAGPELGDPQWTSAWRSPWPQADQRPLVLVSLSSTFQDQAAVLGRIIEALSKLPVRALVTLGLTIAPSEVPQAENVVVVRSAPHSEVVPKASLLVTHCGHGTTMKGLAAGIPLLCIPMGRDQNDTAARVVHAGAGLRLKPTASVEAIRGAAAQLLSNPSFVEAARRLSRAIVGGEGCVDVVQELEGLALQRRAVA